MLFCPTTRAATVLAPGDVLMFRLSTKTLSVYREKESITLFWEDPVVRNAVVKHLRMEEIAKMTDFSVLCEATARRANLQADRVQRCRVGKSAEWHCRLVESCQHT